MSTIAITCNWRNYHHMILKYGYMILCYECITLDAFFNVHWAILAVSVITKLHSLLEGDKNAYYYPANQCSYYYIIYGP